MKLPKYTVYLKKDTRRSKRPSVCFFQGCRSVEEFQCLNRIEEGTYGVVYRAKDKKTGQYKPAPVTLFDSRVSLVALGVQK